MREGDAKRSGQLERDLGRPGAAAQALGPEEVRGKVPVAEAEPGLVAEPAELAHDLPGLAGDAPALDRIGDAGQRVQDGVVVRADRQGVALEVVAGVDDDGQLARREDLLESVRELGASNASGQTDDAHRYSRSYALSLGSTSRPKRSIQAAWLRPTLCR